MIMSPESIHQPSDITAADLIQMLLAYDPETVILIPGYEGGFKPIHTVKKETLLKDVNKEWYYGQHDTVDSVCDPESYQKETFLILC